MDNRKNNRTDAWDESVYGTGKIDPPKSDGGVVALLMIMVIFLSGIISLLSFMNIQLLGQLQQAQQPQETVPMVFSGGSGEALRDELLQDVYGEAASVRISHLSLEGEFVSTFDQHYFTWPAGMLVTLTDPEGRAEAIGLEAGDIITDINGYPITTQAELDLYLTNTEVSSLICVTVHRDGQLLSIRESE